MRGQGGGQRRGDGAARSTVGAVKSTSSPMSLTTRPPPSSTRSVASDLELTQEGPELADGRRLGQRGGVDQVDEAHAQVLDLVPRRHLLHGDAATGPDDVLTQQHLEQPHDRGDELDRLLVGPGAGQAHGLLLLGLGLHVHEKGRHDCIGHAGHGRSHDPDQLEHGVAPEEVVGRRQAAAETGETLDEEPVLGAGDREPGGPDDSGDLGLTQPRLGDDLGAG